MRGNCYEELSLGELLDDPFVVLLMTRDGITRSDAEEVMAGMRLRSVGYEYGMEDVACSQTERLIAGLISSSRH